MLLLTAGFFCGEQQAFHVWRNTEMYFCKYTNVRAHKIRSQAMKAQKPKGTSNLRSENHMSSFCSGLISNAEKAWMT